MARKSLSKKKRSVKTKISDGKKIVKSKKYRDNGDKGGCGCGDGKKRSKRNKRSKKSKKSKITKRSKKYRDNGDDQGGCGCGDGKYKYDNGCSMCNDNMPAWYL